MGQGGAGLCGGQNAKSEVEMVRTCKKEHKCHSRECNKLAVIGLRIGRDRPRKMIRQN